MKPSRGALFVWLSLLAVVFSLSFSADSYQLTAISRWLVVIDAGHGGIDPGAIGPSGVREKEINLKIARILEILALGDPEIQLVLTRRLDQTLPLRERTDMANRLGAALYVSIHCNAHNNPKVQGIETLVHDGPEAPTHVQNLKLAQIIQRQIISRLGPWAIVDRGVKRQPLYIRWANMPAVIVETGFITHPQGEVQLQSIWYQAQIAEAILAGIKTYLKSR